MAESDTNRVPFSDVGDFAEEWTTDNVNDLTDAVLVVSNERRPYYKNVTFEAGGGAKETKRLAYIYCKIDKRILPVRLNLGSTKNLTKHFKTQKVDKWNNGKVCLVHQTIGDKTFLVIKARGGL